MADLARSYEGLFPGTDVPDAQKEERMDRIRFKQTSSVRSLRRRNRTQGIRVPEYAACFDGDGRLKP